jgi:phospholipase C
VTIGRGVAAVVLLAVSLCSVPSDTRGRLGIHAIKHVVVIMQENRSFDSYFGTFPGADGLPRANGRFTVCVPDPRAGTCVYPYHDDTQIDGGAAHNEQAATAAINGGAMDGFVAVAEQSGRGCGPNAEPTCKPAAPPDVMGYHDAREIPNYWSYASNFVLNDHLFQSDASWSKPAHLFMVSGWAATCTAQDDPASCVNNDSQLPGLSGPGDPPAQLRYTTPAMRSCLVAHGVADAPDTSIAIGDPATDAALNACYSELFNGSNFAWTDLTYLLHRHGVSWGYFVEPGTEPDCIDEACASRPQGPGTVSVWNPLPEFTTVKENHQLGNIRPTSDFLGAARSGTLPAVSWVVPTQATSEHPPATPAAGQAHVTELVNAVMQGPDWSSTAIFVSWDDWGGFYDHVSPPQVDQNGYGIRVPGLVISPYAKRGLVDHQVLSFDAYAKFIEDVFLSGNRLDPRTDGRPDPRPTVRESVAQLGDLARDFDFNQDPRPPMILPVHPPPGRASVP